MICPMMSERSLKGNQVECKKDNCAWFIEYAGMCVMLFNALLAAGRIEKG